MLNCHLQNQATREYRSALYHGILVPAERCGRCGATGKIHGHHADYAKPLEVEWLCASCHRKAHSLKDPNTVVLTIRYPQALIDGIDSLRRQLPGIPSRQAVVRLIADDYLRKVEGA